MNHGTFLPTPDLFHATEPHDLNRFSDADSNSVTVLSYLSEITIAEAAASCQPSGNADKPPFACGSFLKKFWLIEITPMMFRPV